MKWDCEMQLLFHTYFASKKRANLLCKSKENFFYFLTVYPPQNRDMNQLKC